MVKQLENVSKEIEFMEQNLMMESIFRDSYLIEKYQNELKKEEKKLWKEELLSKINKVCICCRNYGYKSLMGLYEEMDNNFLKDFIYLLSKIDNNEEIQYIIYLLKPRLYNYNFVGQEYVESVVYYEALLVILEGEMPELVKLRVVSMLAINERVRDILS